LGAVFLLTSIPACGRGQTDGLGSQAETDSLANWVDACRVTDTDLLRLLKSEALLVDYDSVTQNVDGTYNLASQRYTMGWKPASTFGAPPERVPLCDDSRFYEQPQVSGPSDGLPFRSAVQVGTDLVLTAWHGPAQGIPELYAIFGLQYSAVGGGACRAPDFAHIPAGRVFRVTGVVADSFASGIEGDFLLLRLDRKVSDTYPRVRRSGQGHGDDSPPPAGRGGPGQGRAQTGDRLTLISHPEKLATKVDLRGRLYGYSITYPTYPLVTDLHPLLFSSGGMVYNRDQRFVETGLQNGGGASYEPFGRCWKVTHEGWIGALNDSLKVFAQFIPAFELLVTPLDAVVHECSPSSGSCTNDLYSRTIAAPDTAPRRIAYEIHPPQDGTGPPYLLVTSLGPREGTLAPGSSFVVTETINVAGAPCGTHVREYSVEDLTNGFEDVVRHVFDMGPCP